MRSWTENTGTSAQIARTVWKTNRMVTVETGSKLQSRSTFRSTAEWSIQGQRCSTQEFCITARFLCLRRKSLDPLHISTSISNLTEFLWRPNESPEPIRVNGELYTSEASIEAHRELQDSPGEPGLPRVVVLGLMFASDGMTSRLSTMPRSKLSCHAFEPIDYLANVRDS